MLIVSISVAKLMDKKVRELAGEGKKE